MTTTYTTSDGDTVDAVAWRYYGTTAGKVVEALLDANPGLADRGPILPAGVPITMPAISVSPTAEKSAVRLWD